MKLFVALLLLFLECIVAEKNTTNTNTTQTLVVKPMKKLRAFVSKEKSVPVLEKTDSRSPNFSNGNIATVPSPGSPASPPRYFHDPNKWIFPAHNFPRNAHDNVMPPERIFNQPYSPNNDHAHVMDARTISPHLNHIQPATASNLPSSNVVWAIPDDGSEDEAIPYNLNIRDFTPYRSIPQPRAAPSPRANHIGWISPLQNVHQVFHKPPYEDSRISSDYEVYNHPIPVNLENENVGNLPWIPHFTPKLSNINTWNGRQFQGTYPLESRKPEWMLPGYGPSHNHYQGLQIMPFPVNTVYIDYPGRGRSNWVTGIQNRQMDPKYALAPLYNHYFAQQYFEPRPYNG